MERNNIVDMMRMHTETVRMLQQSQIEMIRTVERMNERMHRLLQETQPVRPSRQTRVPRSTHPTQPPIQRPSRTSHTRRDEQTYVMNWNIPQSGANTTFMDALSHLMSGNLPPNTQVQYFQIPLTFNRLNSQFMENVPIRVPHDVIDRACRVYNYDSTTITNTQNDVSGVRNTECPIDLTPFEEGDQIMEIRHCGHRFRETNLRTWFETNPRCPLCRYDVRDTPSEPNSNMDTSREEREPIPTEETKEPEEPSPETTPRSNPFVFSNILPTSSNAHTFRSSTAYYPTLSSSIHPTVVPLYERTNHLNNDTSGNVMSPISQSVERLLQQTIDTTLEDVLNEFTNAFQHLDINDVSGNGTHR